MCKSEAFNRILDAVSNETEIAASEILGKGRTIEVVDARCLFFQMLREKGVDQPQIASKTNRTAAAVRYLLSKYKDRIAANRMVELYAEKVRKQIENNSQTNSK